MHIKILADTTCDLSPELIERYKITTTPLYIECNGNFRKDNVEITPTEIFQYVEKTGKLCHTAAISVGDYEEYFKTALADADGIVHFTISSDMSACYQNAVIAAKNFKNVYVVDSRSLSTGIGHLVIDAAEMAEKGSTAKEICDYCTAARDRLDVSFVLDTLLYLSKGGRCSSLAAFSAGLLNIKPSIEVKNGKMGVGKKYRGKMSMALSAYVRDRLAGRDDLDLRKIFITYSSRNEEDVAAVISAIKECQPFENIYCTNAGGTISNHCGPNCLGILFMTK